MMDAPRVAAIILAAGESRRFGSPKQLLDWQGQPLLRHVVVQTLAVETSEVVVVLGAHLPRIAPAVQGLPITLAVNREWARGMSGSVKLGLRALRAEVDAALFLLADQPGITPQLCQRLIQAHASTHAPIIAPRSGDRPGNPVLFARELFPQLMQVRGDQGGRAVMKTRQADIHWVETDAKLLRDIDRPDDLMN